MLALRPPAVSVCSGRSAGPIVCFFFLICLVSAQTPKQIFTVADSIQATRVLDLDGRGPILLSPNKTKYVIVLQRGDIKRNGSWIDLLCDSTSPFAKVSSPRLIARLFSRSTADVNHLIQNIRWFGDGTHIAFLWDDGIHPAYISSADVQTGRVHTLVQHRTAIVKYDIDPNGRTIVFIAYSYHDPLRSAHLLRSGFPVTGQSVWSLLNGDVDGWEPRQHYDLFVSAKPHISPRKLPSPPRVWAVPPERLTISPDGHYAVAVLPAGDPPPEWDNYTEHILKSIYLRQARQHPNRPNWVRQYFLIDTQSATIRPLWDAPESPFGDVIWAPDSRRIVIGPTFLPVAQADDRGLAGHAQAVFDVRTGQVTCLPTVSDLFGYVPTTWTKDGVIEFSDADGSGGVAFRLKEAKGRWTRVPHETRMDPTVPPVRFEIRESPDIPPALYAVETASGLVRLLQEFNPQLSHFMLAKTELVHWVATDGKAWTGVLYYPVNYIAGHIYPLVIQTHGYSSTEFLPDGPFTTVFAAQPLANHDIAVLQVGGPDHETADELGTSQEPLTYVAGFEGAIQHFVASGLADGKRIGIVGFSRTGWIVLYMLTHSHLPVAAAEVADNVDGSYFQYVLADSDLRTFDDVEKGASPFGEGQAAWMRDAPGFNADKVRTPLRMELDSGPISRVLTEWEMFSNLRYLGRPVELSIIPDIEHGVHVLQNPAQRLASQGGTVDWFRFWLKGEEDSSSAKTGQYVRWRNLRTLQDTPSSNH